MSTFELTPGLIERFWAKVDQAGKLVKIKYNTYRLAWCTPDNYVTFVETLEGGQ